VAYDDDNWRPSASRGPSGPPAARKRSDGPGDQYIEVKERILLFYAKYPDGRLVTSKVALWETADGGQKVLVRAKAYRDPDDPRPGTGTSWLTVPGTTPYTRGSEVENAETSAWGRAIACCGIAVDSSIATAEEVASKRGLPESQITPRPTLAAVVTERLSDAAPAQTAPSAIPEAPVAGEYHGEAPEKAEEPVPAPVEDLTVEAAAILADVMLPGLTMDQLKQKMREKHIMSGQAKDTAKRMGLNGLVSDLSDADRLRLWEQVQVDIKRNA